MNDNKPQIPEAQRTPTRTNTKKNIPEHIIVKGLKPKVAHLESSQKGEKNYTEISNKAVFSSETLSVRRFLRPCCSPAL